MHAVAWRRMHGDACMANPASSNPPQSNPSLTTTSCPQRTITPVPLDEDGRPLDDPGAPARRELEELKGSLADTQPAGSLVGLGGSASNHDFSLVFGLVLGWFVGGSLLQASSSPIPLYLSLTNKNNPTHHITISPGGQVQVPRPGPGGGHLSGRRQREEPAVDGGADGVAREGQGE
jgi:hypothetical protein